MITDEWVIAVCVGEIQIETDWGIKYQKAICFVSQLVFSLVFLGFSFLGGCTFVCSLDLSPRSFSLCVLAYVFEQGLVDLRGSKGKCTSNGPTRCTSDRPASLLWCPPPTHTQKGTDFQRPATPLFSSYLLTITYLQIHLTSENCCENMQIYSGSQMLCSHRAHPFSSRWVCERSLQPIDRHTLFQHFT